MAGHARGLLIDEADVGIYHCYSRCVRRAFLIGEDQQSGEDFNHRKDWLLDRLKELAGIYAIDCFDFGILDNHVHLVLRNRPDIVREWSDKEVYRTWLMLFPKRRNEDGTPCTPTAAEISMTRARYKGAKKLRERLSSISWFHKSLKEPIAKRANAEDDVTGAFWEGRFKSKRLVDEAAVLMCSLYVDLNPLRAGLAQTPEEYCYTSVYARIESWKKHLLKRKRGRGKKRTAAGKPTADAIEPQEDDHWLCPLTLASEIDPTRPRSKSKSASTKKVSNRKRASNQGFLPLSLGAYLELLDWVGRQVRSEAKGRIPSHLASIVDRLGIRAEMLAEAVQSFSSWFGRLVGKPENVAAVQDKSPLGNVHGINRCRKTFR